MGAHRCEDDLRLAALLFNLELCTARSMLFGCIHSGFTRRCARRSDAFLAKWLKRLPRRLGGDAVPALAVRELQAYDRWRRLQAVCRPCVAVLTQTVRIAVRSDVHNRNRAKLGYAQRIARGERTGRRDTAGKREVTAMQ